MGFGDLVASVHCSPPYGKTVIKKYSLQAGALYAEYAGCAITTGIPVKFGTAHG